MDDIVAEWQKILSDKLLQALISGEVLLVVKLLLRFLFAVIDFADDLRFA